MNVSLDIIKSSLATQHLPIVLSYGETTQGQIFPISSWELTAQMSRLLQPKKVMLINLCGGFLDEQGKVTKKFFTHEINLINTTRRCTAFSVISEMATMPVYLFFGTCLFL